MDTFYKVKDEHLRQFDVLYNAVKSVSVALPDAMTRTMGVAVIELERLKNMLVKLEISPTLSALEKQLEAMKCCGNCKHYKKQKPFDLCKVLTEYEGIDINTECNDVCELWEVWEG
jgi:hypothetical protein